MLAEENADLVGRSKSRVYYVAETEHGKEISVVADGRGLFQIQFSTGGNLPQEFRSKFTSPGEAKAVIDAYLAKGKVGRNGKSTGK